MYWNMFCKSLGFVLFAANLTHFGPKSDILGGDKGKGVSLQSIMSGNDDILTNWDLTDFHSIANWDLSPYTESLVGVRFTVGLFY